MSVAEVAAQVGGHAAGNPAAVVSGLAGIDSAKTGDLIFIGNEK